jgi:hypothetical protein
MEQGEQVEGCREQPMPASPLSTVGWCLRGSVRSKPRSCKRSMRCSVLGRNNLSGVPDLLKPR